MKKRSIYFLGLFVAFVLFGLQNSILNAQEAEITEIRELINNPGPHIDEKVIVEGIVKNFVPETSTSMAYYLFEGKFGATIRINTDAEKEPSKLKKYRVTGVVYIENQIPFIHEDKRIEVLTKQDDDNDGVPNSIDKCPNTPAGAEVDASGCKKTTVSNLMLIIIGAAVLVIILIIVVVMIGHNKKKIEEENRRQQEMDRKRRDDERRASEANKSSQAKGNLSADDDFKTIKLFIDDPKTMKFIPGKLEIISGDDKGRTFLISGYPTPEGSVVTLGRENVTGDRKFAHIQLDKRFQTVSRKQAELIYRSGKFYAKNLSSTNPTQVDGRELKVDQTAEVMPGSVIRTGELEFKYTL